MGGLVLICLSLAETTFGEAAAKKANLPPHFAPFLLNMRPYSGLLHQCHYLRVNQGRD